MDDWLKWMRESWMDEYRERNYRLIKNSISEEVHVLSKTSRGECECKEYRRQSEDYVLAVRMDDVKRDKFTEDELRLVCARIGKSVCGNCMRKFYKT